jgi:DNA-directed RNA polymerase specialized sigma24 family protein
MLGRPHPKRRTLRVESASEPAAVASPLVQELEELAELMLRALSARDQEVLRRYYLGNERPEQICADLAITETQFRLIKSRAKARFTQLVEDPPPRKRGPG